MKNFPMFLQMAGRRVLIIGGGEQAAQKARLILKSEAEIVIVSEVLNAELQSYADEGRLVHVNCALTIELMQSAILVFSATGCSGAGAAHAALADQAKTLINVVDMPDLCDAMTPSIVDRDPLVIAIGTEGAAPILGRQIKSKIETFLEPNLGDLVAFAGRMRAEVSQNVAQDKRRGFWNWVFNGLPRQEFSKGNQRRAFSVIKGVIHSQAENIKESGEISVISSSDGAPECLRLIDVAKLQEADLILFVKGKHESILELARRDAERVSYNDQSEIADLLSALDSDGRVVKQNVSIISDTDMLYSKFFTDASAGTVSARH
jgi:uroporphyrin-III C-methyltransferase/precorrin-2 dehydrogenase/sirohydrochlorin ferrochelatase